MKNSEELTRWLSNLNAKKTPEWELLPELELYMDQVLTYLDKHLAVYQKSDEDKVITSSMINNYVKANIIESPVSKKYNKNQLAHLYAISILKRVLPMPDVKKVLNTLGSSAEIQYLTFRETFDETQTKVLGDVINMIESTHDESILHGYMLRLILEANAKLMIANKVLSLIDEQKIEDPKKKEKTDEPKKKEKKEI